MALVARLPTLGEVTRIDRCQHRLGIVSDHLDVTEPVIERP